MKKQPNKVHEYFKKHIIEPNSDHYIDVFLHSFSIDRAQQMILEYKPTVSQFEVQQMFSNKISNSTDEKCLNNYGFKSDALLRCIEYGRKKSVGLMEQYSHMNSIKYDVVISMRSDLIFLKPLVLDQLSFDNGQFYTIGRINNKKLSTHMPSMLFISSQKKIILLAKLFDMFDQYYHLNNHHMILKQYIDTFTKINHHFVDAYKLKKGNHNEELVDCDIQRVIYHLIGSLGNGD